MVIWKRLGLLVNCVLVIDVVSVGRAAAVNMPLPTGSYLQSCKVVSFDQNTGDLSANCDGPAVGMFGLGTPETSTFNVNGCREGTIWNDRRQLYCLSGSAWGNNRVIPAGSYIDTCTDRKIVGGALLTAVCDNGNGVATNASLDLRQCQWGGDISNAGGRLLCVSNASGSAVTRMSTPPLAGQADAGIVKPESVEPGVAKPALIAPVPSTGGAATGEDDPTKKKRKRDRKDPGERG